MWLMILKTHNVYIKRYSDFVMNIKSSITCFSKTIFFIIKTVSTYILYIKSYDVIVIIKLKCIQKSSLYVKNILGIEPS